MVVIYAMSIFVFWVICVVPPFAFFGQGFSSPIGCVCGCGCTFKAVFDGPVVVRCGSLGKYFVVIAVQFFVVCILVVLLCCQHVSHARCQVFGEALRSET